MPDGLWALFGVVVTLVVTGILDHSRRKSDRDERRRAELVTACAEMVATAGDVLGALALYNGHVRAKASSERTSLAQAKLLKTQIRWLKDFARVRVLLPHEDEDRLVDLSTRLQDAAIPEDRKVRPNAEKLAGAVFLDLTRLVREALGTD